jgi:mono/diheme cytochrome c family protein
VKPIFSALVASIVLMGAGQALAESVPGAEALPPGPDRDLVGRVCTACHGLDVFANKAPDMSWYDVVQTMASRGAAATPAELDQIAAYLEKSLSPAPAASIAPAAMLAANTTAKSADCKKK